MRIKSVCRSVREPSLDLEVTDASRCHWALMTVSWLGQTNSNSFVLHCFKFFCLQISKLSSNNNIIDFLDFSLQLPVPPSLSLCCIWGGEMKTSRRPTATLYAPATQNQNQFPATYPLQPSARAANQWAGWPVSWQLRTVLIGGHVFRTAAPSLLPQPWRKA